MTEQEKQILYRDARVTGKYDEIWQNVGKCAFCDLRDKYIILEENGVVLTVALFAYIDGHMMIVTRRHVVSHKELTPEEWATVRKFTYIAKKIIGEVHGVKGMQFLQRYGRAAQSTVEHIHFHCLPFDAPDLSTWNYRTLKNTPLENAALYQKLGKKLSKLSQKYDQKYAEGAQPAAANPYELDWANLAFGSKKAVNDLEATFIAAPRELSVARFTELVKAYLPKGNLVLGLAKEEYIAGFEGQPQFRTLAREIVQRVIDKVNASKSPHKIYTLQYWQRESNYVLEKLHFQKVVLVNGSWRYAFHNSAEYYTLASQHIPYELLSPFTGEREALAYEAKLEPQIESVVTTPQGSFSDTQMLDYAGEIAKKSYDYTFQTGVVAGKKTTTGYKVIGTAFNKVVPYQTYALHFGASRERHFSPPHDLNHYDTIHAEMALIIQAQQKNLSLSGASLFINLLPCPSCSRMLSETDIAEIAYREDHSDGYALRMLEAAGKNVRRIV